MKKKKRTRAARKVRRLVGRPWCHWQTKCQEDTKSHQWTCMAHLAEGHAFQCHKRNMRDAKRHPGRCEDAEPVRVTANTKEQAHGTR